MKKILTVVILGFFILSSLGVVTGTESGNEIIEKIYFSEPMLQEKDDFVNVDVTGVTTHTIGNGEPYLPFVNKVFTFPLGTIVENVEVTFSKTQELLLTKKIAPSPTIHIYSSEYQINNEKIDSQTLYNDIEVYPEERYGYRVGAGLKGKDRVIYLTITVYPIQYNPNENNIYYSSDATINIKYTLPEKPVIFPDEYDFLIIAPEEFRPALEPLVDHKNNLNPPVKTILTDLENIPDYPEGVDAQEDIKYYIKESIENWGITYVLLVGAGVEGEELFPVRYAWIPSQPLEDNFPSDLYYADIYDAEMNFSDWDVDEDGKYAEYPSDMAEVDVHPDVYLGKFPANNAAEIETVVAKIIEFKEHNMMTEKILSVGGDSLPGSDVYTGEYANEKVLEKLPGYTSTRLWGTNGKMTKHNIAKGFKSSIDFADFSGHGSVLSWATHPPDNERKWIPAGTLIPYSPYPGWTSGDYDLFNVNNYYKYPVVVFTACSNNKFTKHPNSLGWTTVMKDGGGGIACFAESGIGHGPGGSAFVTCCIGWMEVRIFEELYNTKELGESWGNCVSDYYTTFEATGLDLSDWKTMLEFSMFGDPTLVVEDGDDPKSVQVDRQILTGILERLIDYFPVLRLILEQFGL
jgi:hypothetical protein